MKTLMKALALLLLVAIAVPAAAQSLTGTVTGTVKDEQGGTLPGVAVTLTGKTGTKTTTTETNGTYRFVALDPGPYSVQTQLAGFSPRRQDNIVVTVGKEAVVDFALKVGGLTESLVVVGEAPVVDTTSSATNNQLSPGPALQHADPPGQHRHQPAELRPRHQRQRGLRRRRQLGQRPADRRRGHPRSFGRHGLDLLQLQHRGGGAVHGHRRPRGVRRLHRRHREHHHQVGRQPVLGPVRRDLHEEQPRQQERARRVHHREPQPGAGRPRPTS